MTKETVEAIQAIGSAFTVAAALGALVLTVRGRAFDAKRAYSEFILKQRLDSAGTLLGAFAAHFQNLSEAKDSRHMIEFGNLKPEAMEWAKKARERAVLACSGSMERINLAAGTAGALFGSGLEPYLTALFFIHRRAQDTGGADLNDNEINKALEKLVLYFSTELNVSGALEYQRNLFLPFWDRWKLPQWLNRWR